MPRLFAALEVPELHRQRLALVRAPLPGAKWIAPEDMHLTLRFFGDIENHTANELVSFLAGIDAAPFEVRITEVGAFGGRDPRIIHAAADGGEPLEALNRACERAARSAGLEPEARLFRPHVTLARLKGTRPEAVARFLGSRGPLGLPAFRVDRFVLYSSRPGSGGGPYVIEDAFPLSQRR